MDKKLYECAIKARENAYAPYSKFRVGAAVRTSDGEIYQGCNVENSSYGITCCAERIAVFTAIAAGAKNIVDMCVVGDTEKPIAPCGACRQVIYEFKIKNIYLTNCKGDCLKKSYEELLPYAFEM